MRAAVLLLVLAPAAGGCSWFGGGESTPPPELLDPVAVVPAAREEPSRVVVSHVLISFEGAAAAPRGVTRTRDEARRLAERVLELARGGRDFAELVRLYSDDRSNDGRYSLANWGVSTADDEVERQKAPRGLGSAAFSLRVGDVGVVEYDVNASPRGWHVVRRTK